MPLVLDFVPDPELPAFCRTPAAADILRVIEFAIELECLGTVVGAPGVGKTTTLRAYADGNPGAVYCVMNPAKSSMAAMLSLVCEALRVPGAGRTDALHGLVCNTLRWGRAEVLLIDEAQHVNDRNLDVLRCIHDETGVPMVFAGNQTLRSRFNNSREASFAQFTSRIGPRAELEMATPADVAALARHAGVHQPKALAWLEDRNTETAGLREVATLLRCGRRIAGKGDIGLDHLEQAAGMLEGAR